MNRAKQFFATAGQQFSTLVHRIISLLERERRAQVVTIVVISVLTAGFVAESVAATRRERNSWSTSATVLVVTAPVHAGDELTADNTTTVALPEALIAVDALRTLTPNTRSRIALAANTPLTRSLTIPSSDAVVIPNGWRVVALPTDVALPTLHIGDVVDVIVGDSVAATDCVVVSVQPLAIGVPQEVAPGIVAAARLAEVSIMGQS
jgi:Flp pilus assembly protein CpaB